MAKSLYLDNSATTHPKPSAVPKQVARAILLGGNAGRGMGGLASSRLLFETRIRIADFFGLDHPERIVFTRNATEGLNMALFGLLKKGDKVVTSALEHNSVVRPLAVLEDGGVRCIDAPFDKWGFPQPASLPHAAALVVTAASNVTGAIGNLKKMCAAAHRKKMLTIVDAAQGAGAIPLDLADVDVFCCTGHKGLLGPQGIGFVWCAKGVEPTPLMVGGTGSSSEESTAPLFWPDRHEAGTVNVPGVAGLNAAIAYLQKRTVAAIRDKEVRVCQRLMEFLGNEKKIVIYGPTKAEQRVSLLSFTLSGCDPALIGEWLQKRGIVVRVGLHCAPAAHRHVGTFPAGSVRVSPGPFTTMGDIEKFISAMRAMLKKI